MLKNKTIIVGVTGGIAAYKACEVISTLKKWGADVWVVETKEAAKLVSPLSFRTLSGNPVITDLFSEELSKIKVPHITLTKKADLIIVVPATANIIAKVAQGIADDPLSTILLSSTSPKIFAPAMNTKMWENPATIENLKILQKRLKGNGLILGPVVGNLACDDIGRGKMESPKKIVQAALKFLLPKQDLLGKRILITAGGTQESLDPVRFIGNRSSGKMGYALAKVARTRGAKVTLISANVKEKPPLDINPIFVQNAEEMLQAVRGHFKASDILVMAAAVADWQPKKVSTGKIKKSRELKISLVPTPDILKKLDDLRSNQKVIGFALETENMLKNAKEKLKNKNMDLIVANTPAAFGADQSRAVMISRKGVIKKLPIMTKERIAGEIFDWTKHA